jgi:uncharacterized protein (TIGR00369 family)
MRHYCRLFEQKAVAMKHEPQTYTVRDAQKISRMCLACGSENIFGLHAQFLNLADGSLAALMTTREEHQSYPGRVHGGIIATILDEVLGRVAQVKDPDVFGVTMEITVKYRAPVPLGEPLLCIAHLEKERSRVIEANGLIILQDGSIAAQGFARYLLTEVDNIVSGGLTDENWFADSRPHPDSIIA